MRAPSASVIREGKPLLDPIAALASAIERARAELPEFGDIVDDERRDRLTHASGDVLRALVWARREAELAGAEKVDRVASFELAGIAVLDQVAHAIGRPLARRLGHSGRLQWCSP